MYGLVNKALKEMVCDRFGTDTWKTIKEKAEIDVETFLSMEAYPDDFTHKLVGATGEVLGLSSSEILEALGEYWVLYSAQKYYGHMLNLAGNSLLEFLQNLDNIYARVSLNFPHLKAPSFRCTHIQKDSLRLHYHSKREGFTPMLKGMLKGLGQKFHTKVEIRQISDRNKGADHDEFSIFVKPSGE